MVGPTHQEDFAFLVTDERFSRPVRVPTVRAATAAPARTRIYVLGYPEDLFETYPAAAEGIISRLSVTGLYQISAPINPGNSGGPLLGEDNGLLGLVVMRHNDAEGMGYALPIAKVAAAWGPLEESGRLEALRAALTAEGSAAAAEPAGLNAEWAVADSASAAGGRLQTIAEACGAAVTGEMTEPLERLHALDGTDTTGVAALLHAAFLWNQTVCELHRAGGDSNGMVHADAIRAWFAGTAPSVARAWQAAFEARLAEHLNPALTQRSSFAVAIFQFEQYLREQARLLQGPLPAFTF